MASSPTPSSCSSSSTPSSAASASSCDSLRSMYSYQTIQSDSRGQFCQILENLSADQEALFNSSPDAWSRMRLVLDFLQPITLLPKHIVKDELASEQLRVEGNTLFKKQLFHEALKRYTMSVLKAPCNSKGLNLALANRSAISFRLGHYDAAVKDAHLALATDYPKEQRFKLYLRMAKCYLRLRRKRMAVVLAEVALRLVHEAALEDAEARQVVADCDALDDEDDDEQETNTTSNGELKSRSTRACSTSSLSSVTSVSSSSSSSSSTLPSLRLEEKSDARGRFVVANRKVQPGEVVWEEEAIASVLYPSRHFSHCQRCVRRVGRFSIPCKMCAGVVFCSIECRDRADFHEAECGCLEVLTGLGCSQVSRLALRIVTQNSLTFLRRLHKKGLVDVAKVKNVAKGDLGDSRPFDARRHAFSGKTLSAETEYLQLMDLVNHSVTRSSKDTWQRSVMAGVLVKLLMTTNVFFKATSKKEDEVLVACHLLNLMQVLQFNAHECYEVVRREAKSIRPFQNINVALAIYGSASYFNHSCHGGVARFFDGNKMSLCALRPVAAHEELNDNYGPTFYFSDVESRRRELNLRYWFHCLCRPCREDWPLLRQLGNSAKNFENMSRSFKEAVDAMDTNKIRLAVDHLASISQKFYEINGNQYCRPTELLVRVEDKLRSCVANMGNVHVLEENSRPNYSPTNNN